MLISKYLQDNKLTQRQFADQIGCTTAFINALINGKNTDIKISLLRRICAKTKLPESPLITELLSHKRDTKKGRQGASGRGQSPKR